MSSNRYYGIKDADASYSFNEALWVTPYEVIDQLKNTTKLLDKNLIHPNELILNDLNQIVDILLLAKYRNKHGNIKLKSILLSQLKSQYIVAETELVDSNLLILKLPSDSYYWCHIETNSIPRYSLRAGYDQITRQFSYIGRMKVSSLLSSSGQIPVRDNMKVKSVSNTITNLIGSLTHFYEYIPAIVLQLHDLSYLDEKKLIKLNQNSSMNQNQSSLVENKNQAQSFWNRLRSAVLTNNSSKDMDFNFISSNYEVLCLKKQPATLKQKCIFKINEISEFYFVNNDKQQFRSFNALPNSTRNLLWPSYLMPGQCLVKNTKMRSSNGIYEITINQNGNLKLIKYILNEANMSKKIVTFEKNIESLLISQTGVYLIFDDNQAMRKPTVLYRHSSKPMFNESQRGNKSIEHKCSDTLLDSSLGSGFVLELSDAGCLRVIVQTFIRNSLNSHKSNVNLIYLLDLNEHFKPPQSFAPMTLKHTSPTVDIDKNSDKSVILSIKIVLNDFREFPQRVFHVLRNILKAIFHRIYRTQTLRN